jgi:hypothetical protein
VPGKKEERQEAQTPIRRIWNQNHGLLRSSLENKPKGDVPILILALISSFSFVPGKWAEKKWKTVRREKPIKLRTEFST